MRRSSICLSMESKSILMVDRTTVDVHAMTKIHMYEARMYVLV